jgi:hypothetical protein
MKKTNQDLLNAVVVLGLVLMASEAFAAGPEGIDEIRKYIKGAIVGITSALLGLNGGVVMAGWLFKVDFLKEWSKEHMQGMIVASSVSGISLAFSNKISELMVNLPNIWGG